MGFINSQKVLLVSFGLVVGLCGVNVLGAIARSCQWIKLAQTITDGYMTERLMAQSGWLLIHRVAILV